MQQWDTINALSSKSLEHMRKISRTLGILVFLGVILSAGCLQGISPVFPADPASSQTPGPVSHVTGDMSIPQPSPADQRAEAISRAVDYQNQIVRNFAVAQIRKTSGGNYSIRQVCDIWEKIFQEWTYIGDPEDYVYYTPASESIRTGLKGNCLDFAILNAAVIQSINGKARVIIAKNSQGVWHAYPEVYMGNSLTEVRTYAEYISQHYAADTVYWHQETDSRGVTRYWLNLDWSADHPGGRLFADNGRYDVYYPDGTHSWFTDTGYPGNPAPASQNPPATHNTVATTPVPLVSLNPVALYDEAKQLPYPWLQWYVLEGGDTQITAEINTDGAPVDVLILDQKNFNDYKDGFTRNSKTAFTGEIYTGVITKTIHFTLLSKGTYYLAVENSPYLDNGADAKKTVYVQVKVSRTDRK